MNTTTIKLECSEFLKASHGRPLLRVLPKEGPDTRKVKVRKKRKPSEFDTLFNSVFSKRFPDLRSRCVFTNTQESKLEVGEGEDEFYIFPIDGFEYTFSLKVKNSKKEYQSLYDDLKKIYAHEDEAIDAFTDVLRYNYQSKDLRYASLIDCEIILYNIPYYYAVRKSAVRNYSTLFSL